MSDMVNVHAKYWKMIGDLDRDKTELRERIKQLEKELMEVKNKHSVLIADVVLDEDRAERIKRLESFINRFLDPEDLGYAVNNYVRDDAREALGRERVESGNGKEKL